jgi:hypothetical protein
MKRLLFLLLIAHTITETVHAQVKPELKITISSAQQITAGSDVGLQLEFTNLTDHDVSCSHTYTGGRDITDVAEVRDPEGNIVAPDLGPHPEFQTSSGRGCGLSAGNHRSWQIGLSARMYGFNKPGVYTIQICRDTGKPKTPKIYSNIITVKVIPKVDTPQ